MKNQLDHIVILDDDPEICNLLQEYLEKNGLRATTVNNGKALWRMLDEKHIDLIVLDLMLPGEDGLELCRNLRARLNIPILILSALGEETDRIIGLEMGADDYLAKPFNPRELLARIKVILRRSRTLPGRDEIETVSQLVFANWTLDLTTRHLISPAKVVIPLSGGEFRLLRVFLEHPKRVLTRDQLLELSQGREAQAFDRSIDVLVGRLRRHLGENAREPRLIQTARGAGYILAADVQNLK
ncbi:response regulator [Candidatus Marithrix sp. Canyon 246]|uniref:response regulator n=1 Tax=Candidatus Marithrix sp. Canyon 246 TaxID=1827136 RepID=UPI00084A1289|nr:response regulator [Candidatus Marithrix sp. Canyon 246]